MFVLEIISYILFGAGILALSFSAGKTKNIKEMMQEEVSECIIRHLEAVGCIIIGIGLKIFFL